MTWLDFNKNGRQLVTNFFFNLNIIFFTIHSSALKLGIYRSSVSASLLVLSVFMCDQKRGFGGHIDFVKLPYTASFGYYNNIVITISLGQGERR